MLLLRLSLLIAFLPGLAGLYVAWMAAQLPPPGQRLLEQALLQKPAGQWRYGEVAALASEHGLWQLRLEDRAGGLLQEWRHPAWQVFGPAESLAASFGQPGTLDEPRSGARWFWKHGGVTPAAAWLALGSTAYCLLLVTGLLQVGRQPRSGELSESLQRLATTGAGPAAPAARLGGRLRALLDTAPLGVVLTDMHGRIGYANERLAAWLDTTSGELRGQRLEACMKLTPLDASGDETSPGRDPGVVSARGGVFELEGNPPRRVILQTERGVDGSQILTLVEVGDTLRELQKLRGERSQLHHILDELPLGVLLTDADGHIRLTNRTAARQFAWGPGELEGETVAKLMPVPFLNQPDITLQDYRGEAGQAEVSRPRVVGWRKDATTFPVRLTVEDLPTGQGELLVLIEDRTESERTAAAQSRLARLFEQTAEEVLILDARSLYVREANRGAQENLGFDLAQLRRMTLFHLAPELDTTVVEPQLARLRAGEQRELRLNASFRRDDKSDYPVAISLTCSREEEPPVLMLLAHDVTALRAAESRLAWISGHDSITRLYNRSAALEELTRTAREGQPCLIGLLTLEGLQRISQEHGYDQGDVLMATLAERLQSEFAEARFLARWSDDTFFLMLDEELPKLATEMAALRQPVELAEGSVTPLLSLGLSPLEKQYQDSLERVAVALKEASGSSKRWALAKR